MTSIFESELSPAVVETLLSHLRQRQFGTRTHIFAELLQGTKRRPEQIRQLNLSHLTLSENTVTVGIPDSYVVSTTGIVSECVVELSARTVEAVKTYIDYERKEQTQNDCQPLFTTSKGRASSSTLRRSIKQASETAGQYSASLTVSEESSTKPSEPESQLQPVLPNNIRQYAITAACE